MEYNRCCCPSVWGFFGLKPSDRQRIHNECFDLIYHGNGGFTWNDVYNMPIWARRFYTRKILDFKQAERQHTEEAINKSQRGTRK